MSNFHFLKKDLEWKIVNLQCRGPAPHIPHNPQTLHSLLRDTFKKELYTLESWQGAMQTGTPIALLFALVRLSSIFVQERKYPLPGESRNEWQIEIWVTTILAPLHHTLRLLAPLFSLLNNNSREKTIHTPLYPFLGSPEMSGKLRYESQIILRYYPHIIHEVSLERSTTTSPCKTIPLERQTTPHLLSHWTTHLQYWWKDYAYSRAQ